MLFLFYVIVQINKEIIGIMSEEVEAHILRKYSLIKKVGSGAYGHVWKVSDKKTGQNLALKKIFDAFQHSTDAQRTFREIVFLHELSHPNIIKLHNVIRAQNDKDLYLVFEFMEADLHNAIGQKILKDIHNRFVIYQLVKGIKFLHSAQLIHRDLKPSNVLLNSDCHLKICDFGLARSLSTDASSLDMIMTEEVATRWYRAPEVLLGSQSYDKSADIWSIGCILGELLLGKPMFPGNSTLNQLQRIISFTGLPNKTDISSLNSEIAQSMIGSLTNVKFKSIKEWVKNDTPKQAIDLLLQMLQFNPRKRPTATQILEHTYLSKFHCPKQQKIANRPIYPPVSDNKKLNLKQYRQLIYQRIKKVYKNQLQQEPTRPSSLNSISRRHNYENRFSTKDESTAGQQTSSQGIYTPNRNLSSKKLPSQNQSFSINRQDSEEKLQKKTPLKDMGRNRKKDESHKVPSSCLPYSYFQKFYRKSSQNLTITKQNKVRHA